MCFPLLLIIFTLINSNNGSYVAIILNVLNNYECEVDNQEFSTNDTVIFAIHNQNKNTNVLRAWCVNIDSSTKASQSLTDTKNSDVVVSSNNYGLIQMNAKLNKHMRHWRCTVLSDHNSLYTEKSTMIDNIKMTRTKCNFEVRIHSTKEEQYNYESEALRYCVVGLASISVILLIALIVVLYLWKYRGQSDHQLLRLDNVSTKINAFEDTARYGRMPSTPQNVPPSSEDATRNSQIYECLDSQNISVPDIPMPPSLDTIPRVPKHVDKSVDKSKNFQMALQHSLNRHIRSNHQNDASPVTTIKKKDMESVMPPNFNTAKSRTNQGRFNGPAPKSPEHVIPQAGIGRAPNLMEMPRNIPQMHATPRVAPPVRPKPKPQPGVATPVTTLEKRKNTAPIGAVIPRAMAPKPTPPIISVKPRVANPPDHIRTATIPLKPQPAYENQSNYSSDEEWTYEPITPCNIYNV